jgi:Right handed beta helix region
MFGRTRTAADRPTNQAQTIRRFKRFHLQRLEDRTVPATITVSGIGDAVGVDGFVTLREAINSINLGANLNADVGAVDAYGTNDTILFNSTFNVAQTINMSGQYTISKAMTIAGPGSGLLTVNNTAAQSNTSRVFNITASTLISGMKITGGSTGATLADRGGGILTTANTTLTDTIVSGNTCASAGGGIAVDNGAATLTLTKCTVTANAATGGAGGGVHLTTGGTLVVTESTISDNSASANGGGVYFLSDGSLTMTRSTVSGNQSTGAKGGGIYLYYTTTDITNSTISGNTSAGLGGGIFSYGATASIKNSTVAFNSAATAGGGIHVDPTYSKFTLTSTIVSNNSAAASFEFDGPVTANFSLIGDAPGDSTGAVITGGNNLTDVDSMLDVLALNGAPAGTPLTHNLKAGSAAINMGTGGPPTDERGAGFPRVQGVAADIGALETPDPAPSATATSPNVSVAGGTTQTVTVVFTDTSGSKLIDQSTIVTGCVTISGPGGFTATPTLSLPTMPNGNAGSVTATFTFTPPINGAAGWDPSDDGTYSIKSVGGIVFDKDTPTANSLNAVTIGTFQVAIPITYVVDQLGDVDDGIYTPFGNLSLREAVDLSNLDAGPSNITFQPTVFAGTKTITMALGEFAISDAFGMTITGPAGGVILNAAKLSRVINTEESSPNAAIALSNLILTNGISPTGFNGGGLRATSQALTLTNVTISNCSTDVRGGGISVNSAGALTLTNCTISGNKATRGGAINLGGTSTVVVSHCSITGNEAGDNGGGIYFFNGGDLSVIDSTISGNKADTVTGSLGGGGIYFFGTAGTFLIRNSTISGNTAVQTVGANAPYGYGGGILLNAFGTSNAVIQNSTIAFNDAGIAGGGIHQAGGTATISSSIIATNSINGAPNATSDIGFLLSTNVDGNNDLIGIQDPMTLATFTGVGVLTGSLAVPKDPLLNALALNGTLPGSPLTHALKSGSPAFNTGNSGGLSNDERGIGFNRVAFGQADIGAFEVQAPPTVTGLQIDNGTAQRSMVRSLTVTFSEAVTFTGLVVNAFALNRNTSLNEQAGVTGLVNIAATQGPGNTVVITFLTSGANPVNGVNNVAGKNFSLPDGRYTLIINASLVTGNVSGLTLDGDNNSTPGGNYVLASAAGPAQATNIFRFFGDQNGDGAVGTNDFSPGFKQANGTTPIPSNEFFDYNENNNIGTDDFTQFKARYLVTFP